MPVEGMLQKLQCGDDTHPSVLIESGNMLIMTLSYFKATGDSFLHTTFVRIVFNNSRPRFEYMNSH